MTERQFRAWMWWCRLEMNVPSRADYYVNQNTSAVAGAEVPMIQFELPKPPPKQVEPGKPQKYYNHPDADPLSYRIPEPMTAEQVERWNREK